MLIKKRFEEKLYETLINKSARDIVTVIRDYREDPRKRIIASKRWIYELIQNAVDAARMRFEGNAEKPELRITVIYNEDEHKLVFEHDGGYFLLDEIQALILGGSTKPYEPEAITEILGKFGRGFLVTHRISRQVMVHGYLYDRKLNKAYEFELPIDREADRVEELVYKINKVIENIEQYFKEVPSIEVEKYCITRFTYIVKEADEQKAVKEGLKHFRDTAPLILTFNDYIKELMIEDQNNKHIFLRVKNENINSNIKHIEILHRVFQNNKHYEEKRISVLIAYENNVEVAIILEKKDVRTYEIIEPSFFPKLFIDIPIIGDRIVKLSIPFIINSRLFKPTQDRSSIIEHDSHVKIFEKAFTLYERLLSWILSRNLKNNINYKGLYRLVKLLKIDDEELISKSRQWSSFNSLLERYRETIVNNYPIVKTESGKIIEIAKTVFPIKYTAKEYSEGQYTKRFLELSEEQYKKLCDLLSQVIDIPYHEELTGWVETAITLYMDGVAEEKIKLYGFRELKDLIEKIIEKNINDKEDYHAYKGLEELFGSEEEDHGWEFYKSFIDLTLDLYKTQMIDVNKDIIKYWPNQEGILIPKDKEINFNYKAKNISVKIELHLEKIKENDDSEIPKDLKDLLEDIYFPVRKILIDQTLLKYIKKKLKEQYNEFIQKVFKNKVLTFRDLLRELLNPNKFTVFENGDQIGWTKLLRSVVRKNIKEDLVINWIKLFKWCVKLGILEEIVDENHRFPIITKDTKVRELDNFENEEFLISFKYLFANGGQASDLICKWKYKDAPEKKCYFEDIFPESHIIHDLYFQPYNIYEEVKSFIADLGKYKAFITKIPIYRDRTTIDKDRLRLLLLEGQIGKKEKHELIYEDRKILSDLPLWDMVIGKLRSSSVLAKCFVEFILKHVMKVDDAWRKEIEVYCKSCNMKHKIRPTIWLSRILTSNWIHIGDADFQPSKEIFDRLFSPEDLNYLLKEYEERAISLLSSIGYDKLDLKIKQRVIKIYGEEGDLAIKEKRVREDLAEKLDTILELTQKLELFGEPDIFSKIIERIENEYIKQERINMLQELGRRIEEVIRRFFEKNGFNVKVMYVGADMIIWEKMSELGEYRVEFQGQKPHHYVVEVKFTTGNKAKLSIRQGSRALDERDKYIVVVVEASENIIDMINSINNVEEITEDLIKTIEEELIQRSHVIENIYQELSMIRTRTDYIEADVDGYWLKSPLWENTPNLEAWVKRIKI